MNREPTSKEHSIATISISLLPKTSLHSSQLRNRRVQRSIVELSSRTLRQRLSSSPSIPCRSRSPRRADGVPGSVDPLRGGKRVAGELRFARSDRAQRCSLSNTRPMSIGTKRRMASSRPLGGRWGHHRSDSPCGLWSRPASVKRNNEHGQLRPVPVKPTPSAVFYGSLMLRTLFARSNQFHRGYMRSERKRATAVSIIITKRHNEGLWLLIFVLQYPLLHL